MKNEPTAEVEPHPGSRPGSAWDAPGAPPATTTPVTDGPSSPAPSSASAPTSTSAATSASASASASDGALVATRRRSRRLVAALAVLLLLAVGVVAYLSAATAAYRERLAWTEEQARAIGTDLATTRAELEGTTAELEAVRTQLATAQERISSLANEKAQIGDDREAQAQLLDYQGRVSEAAGTVASALDRCVRGQDQLITYLENAAQYDPGELAAYGQSVERLCQTASDANRALQAELADR